MEQVLRTVAALNEAGFTGGCGGVGCCANNSKLDPLL